MNYKHCCLYAQKETGTQQYIYTSNEPTWQSIEDLT